MKTVAELEADVKHLTWAAEFWYAELEKLKVTDPDRALIYDLRQQVNNQAEVIRDLQEKIQTIK